MNAVSKEHLSKTKAPARISVRDRINNAVFERERLQAEIHHMQELLQDVNVATLKLLIEDGAYDCFKIDWRRVERLYHQ